MTGGGIRPERRNGLSSVPSLITHIDWAAHKKKERKKGWRRESIKNNEYESNYSISYFTEQLFKNHNSKNIELFVYASNTIVDSTTERLKLLVENWISIANWDDEKIINKIEKDEIGLGEITRLQQEKIEELTLYIIEINKRLMEVEARNKVLETKSLTK